MSQKQLFTLKKCHLWKFIELFAMDTNLTIYYKAQQVKFLKVIGKGQVWSSTYCNSNGIHNITAAEGKGKVEGKKIWVGLEKPSGLFHKLSKIF